MSLWANSTINNNLLASTFTQLYNMKAIDVVSNENGFFNAIIGKGWRDANAPGGYSFERLKRLGGEKLEFRFRAKFDRVSTVANGSGELASATPDYTADKYGGIKVDWTHYADVLGMPSTEYNKIRGKEAKTADWIDDNIQGLLDSINDSIGMGINAASADGPDDEAIGNWPQAVSDGVTSGESGYATYCTIDRSDSGNTVLRGTVQSAPDLTMGKIALLKNTIKTKGGKPVCGLAELNVYTKIQELLESVTLATDNSEEWMRFGGEYLQYGNTKFILENRGPAGVLGLIDPESWVFFMRTIGVTEGFVKAPHLKAGYVMPWEVYAQCLCNNPKRNGKLVNIAS